SRSNSVNTPGPYGYAGVVVHRSTRVTLPCTPSLTGVFQNTLLVGCAEQRRTVRVEIMVVIVTIISLQIIFLTFRELYGFDIC
ncbi:MAG: hypothetical protein ABL933_11270, partial [Methyloglobulus sp.]